jgi:HEAT repeat protein
LMSENSFIGRWPVDPDYPTLSELIYGVRVELPGRSYSRYESSGRVVKEVAYLFEIDRTSKSIRQIQRSNISLTVYMKRGVLFWLGKVGHEQSLSLLQKLYKDTEDDYLKKRLMGHIGDMHHPQVVPFLNSVLQNEESERVRKEAVDELDQYHTQESLDILLRTVRHDSSDVVRREAVSSIGHIELLAAENSLIEIAKTGPSTSVRREAINELRDISSPEVMNCLASIINKDEYLEVQREALEALVRIENEKALDMLIQIVQAHTNPRIRYEAIDELRRFASPKTINCLESVINKQDEVYKIRREALETLTRIENDSASDVLIRIAKTHIDPRIREEAIDKLRDIDELRLTALAKVIQCLEGIINNQKELEKIQRTALDKLAEYETKEALNMVIRIAQTHANPRIRIEAIDELNDKTPSEVIDCLNGIVNKQDELYKVQREALEALARFEDDKALDMLIQIVKTHSSPRIRREAINQLTDIDELRLHSLPKAVSCLASVVNKNDELEENQREALDALAQIGNDRAMDVLIQSARSHVNPRIREEAIDQLSDIDELRISDYPKVIKCFESIIDNQKELEDIQRKALDALKDIEQQDVWAYIEKTAVTHPKSGIRREAQEMIAYRIRER